MRKWADRNRKGMPNFSMGLILYIVFSTFSNSVKSDSWKNLGMNQISIAFAAVLMLLVGSFMVGKFARVGRHI